MKPGKFTYSLGFLFIILFAYLLVANYKLYIDGINTRTIVKINTPLTELYLYPPVDYIFIKYSFSLEDACMINLYPKEHLTFFTTSFFTNGKKIGESRTNYARLNYDSTAGKPVKVEIKFDHYSNEEVYATIRMRSK